MPVETLDVDDVLRIHEILVADFAGSDDPIFPPGVRSMSLLGSAVGRQHVGQGAILKYPEPIGKAATLLYGLCNDHPFHNGNKRSALVGMLAHLDKNRYCLHDTSQNDLFKLMISVADHSIGVRVDPRRPDKVAARLSSDEEVAAIHDWLVRRVHKLTKGERPITFRHLRQALANFGLSLEIEDSNTASIFRVEQIPPSLLRRRVTTRRTRLVAIGYRNEGTEVSVKDLKNLRRVCHLTEEEGVEADAFYSDAAVVDRFLNKYRTVLRRLAKT